ncbi:MAG: hypothetical protein QM698_06710 [Micropepsaceae bacterium]
MKFTAAERLGASELSDADEFLHHPPVPVPARWQENMFFVAWDLEGGHGFLIHTKRWPAKNDHEAHIAIYVDGVPCSAVLHRPLAATPRINDEIPELYAEPEQAWSRWRIRADIGGEKGEGPFGFIAHKPGGDTRATLDIVLESDLPVADFKQGLAYLSDALSKTGEGKHTTAQNHYEQGGRWRGTLSIGDRRVTTSGLFVRDHSWGERVESNFDSGVFWTASSLDGGRLFCNAIGFPGASGTVGVGILVDETGSYVTNKVEGVFTPKPGLLSYDRSEVRYGFHDPVTLTGVTKLHVPKYLPGSGERRYDNNAISHVRIGDKTGMGCLEWAAVLEPAQAETLDGLLADDG